MSFLTFEENIQLQKILRHNKLLQTHDAQYSIALLENCGLETFCTKIQFDKPSDFFVPILYSELSKVNVIVGNSDRLALIVFLEYLIQIDNEIKVDEKYFIEKVINKWEKQNYKPSIQQQKKDKIGSLLSQVRREYSGIPQVETPIKVDQNIIINFDLKKIILRFREKITYEGAFAFSVGGESLLLEKYIIERIRRELKGYTKNENNIFDIKLYKNNVSKHEDIERQFLYRNKYQSLADVFNSEVNTDIIVIVWNYEIPLKTMNLWGKRSWAEMKTRILKLVEKKSRCCVFIWANVNKSPSEVFTILPIEKFELHELETWFRPKLRQVGVAEEKINYYLGRLKEPDGHFAATYSEMNRMIQDLQGGFKLYG